MQKPLPRFVRAKPLASGATAFFWECPSYYRKLGCSIPNEPLGTDYGAACGDDAKGGKAATLNGLFDEWRLKRDGIEPEQLVRYGSIDWLMREYRRSKQYLEKVSLRSRPDYERTMLMLCDMTTKQGDRIGSRHIRSITPRAADKIYDKAIKGKRGERLRQGEKLVALCSKAWRVVFRLYPDQFDRAVSDPWKGVTTKRRTKATKPAVTREQVYQFAWGCIERGRPEPAAAAVICFEWLQRPENVLKGFIRWTDYRGREAPNSIRIEHHKTGEIVLHPLEEQTPQGLVKFYDDAEAVLAKLPQLGVPMIMHKGRGKAPATLYSLTGMAKAIQKLRGEIGLPATFTLDACRHGGMTELEEAELTDGQGRALSAHRSDAYNRYAKRTEARALAATRKRHAHRITASAANEAGTDFRNGERKTFRNEFQDKTGTGEK